MRTTWKLSLALTLAMSTALTARADDRDPANYVGTKTCGICHKQEASGNQYGIWQNGPHAKAFDVLGTPAAKTMGAKFGVADPQTSGKCLKCHSTAYNFTETIATDRIKPEDAIGCESCHGPGKKYLAKTTMQDRTKAVAAGLVYPADQSCQLCHNDQSPTWTGSFDKDAMVKKIAHPDPKVQH